MIIPALIPQSFEYLNDTLDSLSFAKNIQIDVVDGEFVADISWPYKPAGSVANISYRLVDHEIEIDLMVSDPVAAGRAWLEAGAKALVFHLESLASPEEAMRLKGEHSFKLAFSINNDTPLDILYPYVDSLDFVQLMGIAKIGSQGQPFDERVLERVASLRALYPELVISVDGGVNKETIAELKQAGASRLVVGSAILKSPDPKQTYEELLRIVI